MKVSKSLVRRVAKKAGYRLASSRVRVPGAIGSGCFALIDIETNAIVHGLIAENFFALELEEALSICQEELK